MELIQNWSSQDKTKLLDRILEVLGDKEYIDIVVYGSRVSGGFNVKSDIDVGVYVNGIYHPENELGNWFVMDITFHLATKIKTNKWTQFDETYDLPKYSLITNNYYPGNKKQTKAFKAKKY